MSTNDRLRAARRAAGADQPGGPGWGATLGLTGLAAAIGASVAYLLDPSKGRGRRARMRDQGAAALRHAAQRGGRMLRTAESTVAGRVQALRARGDAEPLDDAALANRAESILFRDPSLPKGAINLNVQAGVLVLRGEVPDAETRDHIGQAAAKVRGVWSVQNLLHLPGEPADERVAQSAAS
jgi:hypothetical protein